MPTMIIKDWAGNILNHKGNFERPQFAVPMEFTSFDDAESYLSEKLGDDYETDRQELFIERKGQLKCLG